LVIEASGDWQGRLVEQACEALETGGADVDPYGVVLWPAAQVLAQAAAAYVAVALQTGLEERGGRLVPGSGGGVPKVLELGAGCGLASLAAARLGAEVLATDFRRLPLELLEEAARRQGLESRVRTALFDVCDESAALPEADLVIASDLVYEKVTAVAMAKRVAEARRRGSAVLIADIGRPNRRFFLEELGRLLPGAEADFSKCSGLAVQRSAGGAAPKSDTTKVRVEVLELPPGPATSTVKPESPCVLLRPPGHKHVL